MLHMLTLLVHTTANEIGIAVIIPILTVEKLRLRVGKLGVETMLEIVK